MLARAAKPLDPPPLANELNPPPPEVVVEPVVAVVAVANGDFAAKGL